MKKLIIFMSIVIVFSSSSVLANGQACGVGTYIQILHKLMNTPPPESHQKAMEMVQVCLNKENEFLGSLSPLNSESIPSANIVSRCENTESALTSIALAELFMIFSMLCTIDLPLDDGEVEAIDVNKCQAMWHLLARLSCRAYAATCDPKDWPQDIWCECIKFVGEGSCY